jgi:hypothetical protein
MKRTSILILLVLASIPAIAAEKYESTDSLKARAASTQRGKQAGLYAQVAERQLDLLAKSYEGGDFTQAESALRDVVDYGIKAAQSAMDTGKEMKKTEITLRKIATRLEDIRKTLSVDDRPAVGEAVQKLDTARTELLHHMFKR